MAVTRLIIAAMTAALLGACSTAPQPGEFSASMVSSRTAAKHGLTKGDSQAVEPSSADTRQSGPQSEATSNQDSAVQKAAFTLSSLSDPTNKAYVIGPRDVLEVNVFKVPELSKTVQVSEAGTISYPLVGELQANGRTARQIEQDLTKTLGAKYLQKPQISVSVKEYNSQRITMDGAFKKSGVFPLTGGLTLLQATANAGGFDENAEETVILFRQSTGNRVISKYDVSRIREGRDEDVQLEAGDVLIAPNSRIKQGVNSVFKFLPLATMATLHL
jgi:polysaccharide biosynthesis/export protein